jgi:hypothetical protein
MTVAELIEALSKYSGQMTVAAWDVLAEEYSEEIRIFPSREGDVVYIDADGE